VAFKGAIFHATNAAVYSRMFFFFFFQTDTTGAAPREWPLPTGYRQAQVGKETKMEPGLFYLTSSV